MNGGGGGSNSSSSSKSRTVWGNKIICIDIALAFSSSQVDCGLMPHHGTKLKEE